MVTLEAIYLLMAGAWIGATIMFEVMNLLMAVVWIGYRLLAKFRHEQRCIDWLLDIFDRNREADSAYSEDDLVTQPGCS